MTNTKKKSSSKPDVYAAFVKAVPQIKEIAAQFKGREGDDVFNFRCDSYAISGLLEGMALAGDKKELERLILKDVNGRSSANFYTHHQSTTLSVCTYEGLCTQYGWDSDPSYSNFSLQSILEDAWTRAIKSSVTRIATAVVEKGEAPSQADQDFASAAREFEKFKMQWVDNGRYEVVAQTAEAYQKSCFDGAVKAAAQAETDKKNKISSLVKNLLEDASPN